MTTDKDPERNRTLPETLVQALSGDRLASAYFLYGKHPENFTETALRLMQGLTCDTLEDPLEACGECRDCIQTRNLTHPDVSAPGAPGSSGDYDPDGSMGVQAVRDAIIEPASLTAARGPYKLFWLHNMRRFTTEASNSLLKVLEEPPGDAVFLLTSRSRWDCLATIRSRCQWIRIPHEPKQYKDFEQRCREQLSDEPIPDGRIDQWFDLLKGESRSREFNWSRRSARQFLEFLLLLINEHYTDRTKPAGDDKKIVEKLSYRLVPDILQRLDELERGGNPSLIVNSILEDFFYPKETRQWARVT